jgi:glutathione peroxidase
LIYPVWMLLNKLSARRSRILVNKLNISPPESFYNLTMELNNGNRLNFDSLKGKKILFVNTASDCGYTNQYEELQKLFTEKTPQLLILGFPANDFKAQEKRTDEEIAQFCKLNFGVSFPLAKKSTVIKTPAQNPVFKWLTDKTKNGWTNKQPSWNFSKWLVNEEGKLTHYFDPAISPLSEAVMMAIEQ